MRECDRSSLPALPALSPRQVGQAAQRSEFQFAFCQTRPLEATGVSKRQEFVIKCHIFTLFILFY